MNAGLTNLDTLKKHLLPSTLTGEPRFDTVIQTLGLGVAAWFDQYCNRRFGWLEDDTMVFSGDRPHYYLPRFPVSVVTRVEMRYFQTDNWTEITGQPINVNYETGLIHFGYFLGRWPLQVRATWSGGYWFEPLEPDDDGYPSDAPTLPADANIPPARAFLLPNDLRAAFLTQCQHGWDLRDKLGAGLADKPKTQTDLEDFKLVPMVKQILQQYVRYQLS